MTSPQLSVYPVMQMFRHLEGHQQSKIIRIKHKMISSSHGQATV